MAKFWVVTFEQRWIIADDLGVIFLWAKLQIYWISKINKILFRCKLKKQNELLSLYDKIVRPFASLIHDVCLKRLLPSILQKSNLDFFRFQIAKLHAPFDWIVLVWLFLNQWLKFKSPDSIPWKYWVMIAFWNRTITVCNSVVLKKSYLYQKIAD